MTPSALAGVFLGGAYWVKGPWLLGFGWVLWVMGLGNEGVWSISGGDKRCSGSVRKLLGVAEVFWGLAAGFRTKGRVPACDSAVHLKKRRWGPAFCGFFYIVI